MTILGSACYRIDYIHLLVLWNVFYFVISYTTNAPNAFL